MQKNSKRKKKLKNLHDFYCKKRGYIAHLLDFGYCRSVPISRGSRLMGDTIPEGSCMQRYTVVYLYGRVQVFNS
jgi:hypothetical protein